MHWSKCPFIENTCPPVSSPCDSDAVTTNPSNQSRPSINLDWSFYLSNKYPKPTQYFKIYKKMSID